MTPKTANPDLTSSHYTRVSERGEAGRKATPVPGRMQPSSDEIIIPWSSARGSPEIKAKRLRAADGRLVLDPAAYYQAQ